MTKTFTVTGCNSCPMRVHDQDYSDVYCVHPRDDSPGKAILLGHQWLLGRGHDYDHEVDDHCPLRVAPVLIQLGKDAGRDPE